METLQEVQFHNTLIRPNIGEFLGSIIFSFLACFSGQYQHENDFLYPLLTAFSLFISRSLVSHSTPAYFNPAVTITQLIRQQIKPALAITFIFVQLIGFSFGVTLFRSLVTQTEFNDDIIMYELVEVDGIRKINRLQALVLEAILTAIFLTSFNSKNNKEATVSFTWGFIQFISYQLFGFTSNISLLVVTSLISYIFSPTTTPSFNLLYLNLFSTLLAIVIAVIIDVATRPKLLEISEEEKTSVPQDIHRDLDNILVQ